LSPFAVTDDESGSSDSNTAAKNMKEPTGNVVGLYQTIIKMSAENVCSIVLFSTPFHSPSATVPNLFSIFNPFFIICVFIKMYIFLQKINAKNTWSLPLIENMHQVIADEEK
jgi:hypothetical protein